MKGKILGFTPATGIGAIAGESGERFSFVAAEWRSDKPISAGTTVDFAPVEGKATEIYPVAGGASVAAENLAASPAVQKARGLLFSTLAFPLAVLLLLATFLPVLSGPRESASLWTIGDVARLASANPLFSPEAASEIREGLARLDEREQDLRNRTTGFAGMPIDNSSELRRIAEQRTKAQAALSQVNFASTITSLLAVRWLVPILAAALLFFVWTGRNVKPVTLAAGGVAIVAAAIFYEYREALIGSIGGSGEIGSMLSRQVSAAVTLGIGTYAIGLLGVALVLAGFGIIRNPLAARA